MFIRGIEVDIDFEEELEPFTFDNSRVRGEKLQACSPFRQENSPSFAVNLDNGSWVDSGADVEEYRKGNFIKLLCFLRGESYEDTEDYLLEKYGNILEDTDNLTLDLGLMLDQQEVTLLAQDKYITRINKPCRYLLGRGITVEVQRLFNTGLSDNEDAVTIPWHDVLGRVINMKYRKITTKDFWYSGGGQPVKQHVYGLHQAKAAGVKVVWVVESEIDCLYLWSLGIPAVALGGASMSAAQLELLISANISEAVIATDSDSVGRAALETIAKRLTKYMQVYYFDFPQGVKDVNELSKEQLISIQGHLKLYLNNWLNL